MQTAVSSFWQPRAACPAEQYEDAFWPRRAGRRAGRRLRVAVADGASESMLSGVWADLLVRTWGRSRRCSPAEVLATAMAGWEAEVAAYLDGRAADRRPIQWFEEPGLARGAHATLLGVELRAGRRVGGPAAAGWWSAVSLGDSCLFQVRGAALIAAFPLARAEDFGPTPKLVPTDAGHLGLVLANLERAEGDCRAGDVLLLATDALAAWFVAAAAAGARPWAALCRFGADDRAGFAAWVATERAAGRLRDDDVTLVRVEVLDR